MAILTNKPASISKGQSYSITLDKLSLKSDPAITDLYFKNDANWKTVSVDYKNSNGQKRKLVFHADQASPTDFFVSSAKARSDFQVQSITIYDKDNGVFRIPRAALTVAEFDLQFAL